MQHHFTSLVYVTSSSHANQTPAIDFANTKLIANNENYYINIKLHDYTAYIEDEIFKWNKYIINNERCIPYEIDQSCSNRRSRSINWAFGICPQSLQNNYGENFIVDLKTEARLLDINIADFPEWNQANCGALIG